MSSTDPSVHCDCRQKSINRALVITLAVGLCAAVLRAFVFTGAAQISMSVIVAVAIIVYGGLQLFNPSATMHRLFYIAIIAAGLFLAGLRISALLA